MKNSKLLLVLCCIALALTSCKKEGQKKQDKIATKQDKSYLPAPIGKISSLYLYMDQTFKGSPLRDTLVYHLEQPYLITPSPVPAIDIERNNFKTFSEGRVSPANNLIVVNTKEDSQIAQYARKIIGPAKIKSALNGQEFALVRAKDINAKPQQLFFLLFDGFPQLAKKSNQKKFEQIALKVIEETTEVDNQRIVANFSQKRNPLLEKMIKDSFQFNMWVPRDYKKVEQKPNFLWFLHETDDLYSNFVVYKQKRNQKVKLGQQVFSMRDDFGKEITTVHREGSRMTTALKQLPLPIQRELTINGKTVVETRGLWEMVNDKMGGGFVNYSFVNDNNEVISIDGFVFYTEDNKRRKMRDIDAILSTVRLK